MARTRVLHPSSNSSKSTSSDGDPPYRKKGAGAVVLQRLWQGLLLAVLLVLPLSSTEAGDIWITGHDVDWHGGQNGYDYHVFEYLRNGTPALVTDYEIAIIGTTPGAVGTSPPSGWSASGGTTSSDYRNQMTFYSTTNLDTGTAGPSGTRDWGWVLNNSNCLVILSHDSIASCSLTDDGVDSLYLQRTAIQSAFNSGDLDLFVLSGNQCSASGAHGDPTDTAAYHAPPYYYDFLSGTGFLSGSAAISSGSGFYITTAGCAAGLEGDWPDPSYPPPYPPLPWPSCSYSQCGSINMVNYQTHNSFGYEGVCYDENGVLLGGPTYNQSLLVAMETLPDLVHFSADCPDGDVCELVISVANTNIMLPGDCIEVVDETIECIPVEEGGFDYSVQLINNSGFDVVKILIPDVVDATTGVTLVDIEPNVIIPPAPIENGDPLPDLNLTFSGVASGDDFPLTVVLMAKDETGLYFECCSYDLDIELPICCNELVEHEVHCQDSDGNFPFEFSFLNWDHIGPTQAYHAFLLPITPGISFEPDYIDLVIANGSTVDDGIPSTLLTTYIYGAVLNQEITFELIIHNEDMSECCNQVHTIVTSDCTAGGGGGGNASSEASFLRGDANTDGSFDIADVIRTLGFLFQNLPASCLLALDSNDDEQIDIGDSIYSLDALFGGGPSPWPPYQLCGVDETEGTLDCDSFPACESTDNESQGG